MRRFLPALSILIVILISQRVDAVNDVIVKYNKLFVDGKEYIIKGMAYNPAPLVFGTTVRFVHLVVPRQEILITKF